MKAHSVLEILLVFKMLLNSYSFYLGMTILNVHLKM